MDIKKKNKIKKKKSFKIRVKELWLCLGDNE